ncbi:hypothetical protein ACLKA6_013282 [Drosophila palustris]
MKRTEKQELHYFLFSFQKQAIEKGRDNHDGAHTQAKQKSQCSEANEATTAKGTATKKKQTQVQEAVKCKKQRIAAERKKESCVGSKNSVTSVASDFIVKHASKGISLGWRLIYMLEREREKSTTSRF